MSGSSKRVMGTPAVVLAAGIVLAAVALLLGSCGGDTSNALPPKTSLSANKHGRCTRVVASVTAAQSAVSAAPSGSTVCLADGTYGSLSLDASKGGPGVVLRAAHPGGATIGSTVLDGSHLTLSHFDVNGEVTVQPGTIGMTVNHNRISGGYFGIDAGPTTTTTVNDVSITGNKFVGPFGEDAIRLNRYHDVDGNGVGALIQGNEFTNVRENGNHSDCLQTVWVGDHLVYRRNYLHDNRCQGFFVKDQASPVNGIDVEDNLFVRDNAPCDNAPGCGQPGTLQIFGPYTGFVMRQNTIWGNETIVAFQNGTGPDSRIEDNVVRKLWTSTSLSGITYRGNTRCQRQAAPGGSWPTSTPGESVNCNPHFANPATDDYRLRNGRGVDWAPARQHYGP